MGRFFKKTPKAGLPLSTKGIAEGLAKIERALDNMDVMGGYVDWNDNIPTIMPTSTSKGANLHSFKPYPKTATTATVNYGYVYAADGSEYSTATQDVDFETNTHFYISIFYELDTELSPDSYISTGISTSIIGTTAALMPDFYVETSETSYRINVLLFTFESNTFKSLVRRQTNDIIDCWRDYDHITDAPDRGEPWPTPPTDGTGINHSDLANLNWDTAGHSGRRGESDPFYETETYAAFDTLGNAIELDAAGLSGKLSHSALKDIVDGTAGDDHVDAGRGGEHGSVNVSYLNLDGDETRNSMPADTYIGDGAATPLKSIYPHLRQLMNGATVVLDWALRKLSGGAWNVTNTTAAGDGTGALIVDGGVYVAKSIYSKNGGASTSGTFVSDDGLRSASMTPPDAAATFVNSTALPSKQTKISTATYGLDSNAGINAGTPGFYHLGVQGSTYTASKVQIPLEGGGYWTGYIRGGILTDD